MIRATRVLIRSGFSVHKTLSRTPLWLKEVLVCVCVCVFVPYSSVLIVIVCCMSMSLVCLFASFLSPRVFACVCVFTESCSRALLSNGHWYSGV